MGFAAGFSAGFGSVMSVVEMYQKKEERERQEAAEKAKLLKEESRQKAIDSREVKNNMISAHKTYIEEKNKILANDKLPPEDRVKAINDAKNNMLQGFNSEAVHANNLGIVDNEMQGAINGIYQSGEFEEEAVITDKNGNNFHAPKSIVDEYTNRLEAGTAKIEADGTIKFTDMSGDTKQEQAVYKASKFYMGKDKESKYNSRTLYKDGQEVKVYSQKEEDEYRRQGFNPVKSGDKTEDKGSLVYVYDQNGNLVKAGNIKESEQQMFTDKNFTVKKQFKEDAPDDNRDNYIIYDTDGNAITGGYMTPEEARKIGGENSSIVKAAKGEVEKVFGAKVKDKRRVNQQKLKMRQMNFTFDRATKLIQENGQKVAGWGSLLSIIPSSDAKQLETMVSELKANLSFESLNNMRSLSATGAGLGSITEKELELLGNSFGGFEQAQSPADLVEALEIIKSNYNAILNGGRMIDPDTKEEYIVGVKEKEKDKKPSWKKWQ